MGDAAGQATRPGAAVLEGVITSHPGWPEPRVSDVDSVDHIVAALYDVISGPPHQPRNWNRMRSLFVPGARLAPVRPVPGTPDAKTNPATDVSFLTVEEYIAHAAPRMEAEGFFERGVHNELAQYADLTSVFSTYESRRSDRDAVPIARGINAIQLIKDGGRYWIVEVLWEAERPEAKIPAQYLPATAPAAAAPGDDAASFVGDWTGQLEYRDYQTNERVFLPTWLSVHESGDAGHLTFAYTYDDGPDKGVREILELSLSPAARTATLSSEGDHASSFYQVAGFDDFTKNSGGKLVLTGRGTDDHQPSDVRLTLTLNRNLLSWLKETRPAGSTEEFKFRDQYTLTRAVSPYDSSSSEF